MTVNDKIQFKLGCLSLQFPPPDPPHHHSPGALTERQVELLQLPDARHHLPLHVDLHIVAEGPQVVKYNQILED